VLNGIAVKPISEFVAAEMMSEKDIGIGHEVFVTGYSSQHKITLASFPIIRHGNIAMVPDDPTRR
jgi:hypothetical protein